MYKKLLKFSIILALIVVILGAYTRLSNAGLGCPDWPGCYGQIIVPDMADGTKIEGYDRPLETAKGWIEMIHRYAASALGLTILILWFLTLKGKTQRPQSMALPSFTALFVMLQGAFGMWTVTLMVHPGIVTIHLLGGFITSALLIWMFLNQNKRTGVYRHVLKRHKYLLLIVLLTLSVQIALGGWTSTNYAALSCGDYFPTCLNTWWPEMDFSSALYWGPTGTEYNYEYGVLENQARIAIQMLHRIGALLTTILIISLLIAFKRYVHLKKHFLLIGSLLAIQISLGVLNIVLSLPIAVAVLHNGVALLLLLSFISLVHKIFKEDNYRIET